MPLCGWAHLVILFVLGNLIDEEQAQHLDALVEKRTLPLDVGENRLSNLDAAELVFADLANDIPGENLHPVKKLHGVVPPIDELDHKAVFVLVQIAGVVVQVKANTHFHRLFAYTLCALEIKLQGGCGVGFGKIDSFQIDITLCGHAAGFSNAFHGNLFHQPLVVGLHGVQPIDHIVDAVRLVGGGVTQGEQGMELLQPLLGLLALFCLGDDVNGAARTELVQLHIDAPGILAPGVERLGIDDHHIDGAVGGEAVDFGELRGIVDEEADLLPIFLSKMLLRHLKGLVHALPDGNARHHNDKLAPPVMLVQLVHGLDVGVCLADTCFHLDSQVVMPFQMLGWLDLTRALYLLQMLQNNPVGQFWHNALVAPAGEVVLIAERLLVAHTSIHHIGWRKVWLPGEDIHHGLGSVGLKFLMFELKFH